MSQKLIPILRDILSLAGGLFVILHEELTGRVSPYLLLVAASMLGLPGVVALSHLYRGSGGAIRTTEQSSSSVPSLPSAPPQPPPPSSLSG